jgi:hypothetical protein
LGIWQRNLLVLLSYPLSDKDLSVDDMGAAPPGWYTVEKEIELRTLTSDYTWQFGKRQKKTDNCIIILCSYNISQGLRGASAAFCN